MTDFLDIDENGMVTGIRHSGPDYLNPHKIYAERLGVSNLESTTPTAKESLAVRTAKSSEPAPIRENLTTAESAEKCRVGEPGYPAANGRQEKNGTGIEEIERGGLDLQVGTAKPGTETVPNCGTETRQSAEWARKAAIEMHWRVIVYADTHWPESEKDEVFRAMYETAMEMMLGVEG